MRGEVRGADKKTMAMGVAMLLVCALLLLAIVPAGLADPVRFKRERNTAADNDVSITELMISPDKEIYDRVDSITVTIKISKDPNKPFVPVDSKVSLMTPYGEEVTGSTVSNYEPTQNVMVRFSPIPLANVRPDNYVLTVKAEPASGTDKSMSDNIASIYITVVEKSFTIPEIPIPLAAFMAALVIAIAGAGRGKKG